MSRLLGSRIMVRNGTCDSPRASAPSASAITSMQSRIDNRSPMSRCERTIKSLLLAHERVFVIRRRREGLLDRARADPAHEVELGACLVVRARSASTAEWLHADHGAG